MVNILFEYYIVQQVGTTMQMAMITNQLIRIRTNVCQIRILETVADSKCYLCKKLEEIVKFLSPKCLFHRQWTIQLAAPRLTNKQHDKVSNNSVSKHLQEISVACKQVLVGPQNRQNNNFKNKEFKYSGALEFKDKHLTHITPDITIVNKKGGGLTD